MCPPDQSRPTIERSHHSSGFSSFRFRILVLSLCAPLHSAFRSVPCALCLPREPVRARLHSTPRCVCVSPRFYVSERVSDHISRARFRPFSDRVSDRFPSAFPTVFRPRFRPHSDHISERVSERVSSAFPIAFPVTSRAPFCYPHIFHIHFHFHRELSDDLTPSHTILRLY